MLWDEQKWPWIAIGFAVGIGTLAKFSMPLWMVGLFLFLALSREHRFHLRTPWPWIALVIAALWTTPVFIWNAHRGWVTFLHVGEDVGARLGKFQWANLLDFWAGQLGVIGPMLIVVMAALGDAILRKSEKSHWPRQFLLCIGLPLFLAVLICSFRANPAANWAAAAYFTFFILTADFLLKKMSDPQQWRAGGAVLSCAIAGMAVIVTATTPVALPIGASGESASKPADCDRQIRSDSQGEGMGRGRADSFRSCDGGLIRWSWPAIIKVRGITFYMRGQPMTYCAGSYQRPGA
jgi:hypothetical protein